MKYAYFPGCKIPHHLPSYDRGVREVCAAFGIKLLEPEFNCCGWPMRDESFLASMYSAARNLALAGARGLDILTPCKCCFGNLKQAQARLDSAPALAEKIKGLLAEEGLTLQRPGVFHLLSVLDEQVGAEAINSRATHPLDGIKVACHYGCHALRPAHITGFDDPRNPVLFERLIRALGARPVDWELRLECCGQPLQGKDEAMARSLMDKKLLSAQNGGADLIATACTHCQLQFQQPPEKAHGQGSGDHFPPAVLFTSLISAALGSEWARTELDSLKKT